MLDSLYIAATGMESQQTYLNSIANNLSNINTNGYKKETISFQDIMSQAVAGSIDHENVSSVGGGSTTGKMLKEFSTGELKPTERDMDVVIQGKGFFEVYRADGSLAYTRDGNLHLSSEGNLVTRDNNELSPNIQIPQDATQLLIQQNGVVTVVLNEGDDPVEVGQIEIANFANSAGLRAIGGNLYVPTEQSGDVYYANPGDKDAGQLIQGFLESSNVNLVEEMINMVFAQRAYEVNSKVIQASDEMLGIINNLRR